MSSQDPLEEVDLGDGAVKRTTYISAKVQPDMKKKVVELHKEFKDCFSWDYSEIKGLSRDMVELKLPIQLGKKSVRQFPRRFTLEIMSKIKQEIERLIRSKFIRTIKYVE